MFSVNKIDFLKGLILAIGGPLLLYIQQQIPGWNLNPMIETGISFLIAYLLKNFFTNDVKAATKTLERHADKTKTTLTISPKLPLLIGVLLLAGSLMAQSPFKPLPKPQKVSVSPFHRLPIPQEKPMFSLSTAPTKTTYYTAYRFTPFAGYSVKTRQVVAAMGFGWNKLHFVDSTQRYYTDLSVMGVIYAGGNTTPNIYNFTSVGVSMGVLNQLFIFGPCYTLPSSEHPKGAFGAVISLGVPLN